MDRIEPGKKGSKAISIRLRPNTELVAQIKQLQIKFLEESGECLCGVVDMRELDVDTMTTMLGHTDTLPDYKTLYGVLCQVVGLHAVG